MEKVMGYMRNKPSNYWLARVLIALALRHKSALFYVEMYIKSLHCFDTFNYDEAVTDVQCDDVRDLALYAREEGVEFLSDYCPEEIVNTPELSQY